MIETVTRFVPASDYLHLPRAPQPWVIEKLIPIGGLINLFGKPKTGKSFLALGFAQAIVNGWADWQGYPILSHGPVAYLQIDTPREEWSNRLSKINLTEMTPERMLYIADMWQVPEFPFNILSTQQTELRWLKESLATIQPVLTIIDTLREVHSGDENDSTTMRNVIANLVDACRPSAILLLSHSRKDSMLTVNGDDDMMDQGRGSSYVAGRMDVVMKMTQKRLMFKGRATGQTLESIQQDQTNGLISIEFTGTDAYTLNIVRNLKADHPQKSQTELAKLLAIQLDISVSTATRRLRHILTEAK